MSYRAHAVSFMLPLTVGFIVPSLLLFYENGFESWLSWPSGFELIFLITGILLIIAGMILLVGTIQKFAKEGGGTLSPHHPTQKLVVTGVYRHVRNPMITGVLLILLGESSVFFSVSVFFWFLFFFIGNHLYFIKSEEPGLVKRFGEEYLQYKENVPRWIPRRSPWSPPADVSDDQVE